VPGAGSAIFFHIRRGVNRATTGCTTMAEADLIKMIAWMRASRHPCYVLLPADEYEKRWRRWDLPPPEKTALQYVAWVPRRTHPRDHFYQVRFSHGRATGRGPVDAAANVEKYRAARSRHGWIRVMPDLDEPMVGEIPRTHFFVGVIVGRILCVDHDVAIIIRRA